MAEPEARFCTTEDGVRIAYCVEGEGPPLLLVSEMFESFTLDHLFPALASFYDELRKHHQLIRFDRRGVGLSQREVPSLALETFTLDVEAVIRAARVRRPAVWASGGNGPGAIAYAATRPRQLSRLALYGTFAKATAAVPPETLLAYATLWRTRSDIALQTFADLAQDEACPEAASQLASIYKQSVTVEMVARELEAAANGSWDASGLLAELRVPTLVVHRRADPRFPFTLGQALASAIPNARLVALEGAVHHFALGDADAVLDAVLGFLAQDRWARWHQPAPDASSPLRIVLFTDVVGHAEMMQRLGDDKGRDVLREHERITRETLAAHSGIEIKTMGDGFMASFGSVTKAMDCAIALQRAFAIHSGSMPEPLHVRVGLNAGEPIEEDGDLFGSTVILASRICAQAGPNEILVPDPVRHLVSGKDFLFSDRGDMALKGFEDPVRLYEVRWRDA